MSTTLPHTAALGHSLLLMPPRCQREDGAERRVGVELEMSGIDIDQLANLAASILGLTVQTDSRYERRLIGDAAGDWIVELDFNLLKQMGRSERNELSLLEELEQTAEELLALGATHLVPVELITPPLPLGRLQEFESIVSALRDAGARGTSSHMLYAFALQFNPEVPALDAGLITDYLRAFLCLYDWLEARADINFTRRLTSYIDPFPRQYIMRVIAPRYQPDMPTLIDDYLFDNATRNRALDLLPLFCHIDETRVRNKARDVLIKARPTFHYRLPNCEIDDPRWGLHHAWNDWVMVERLAEDKDRLRACCLAYLEHLQMPFHLPGHWLREIEQHWLQILPADS